MLSRPHLKLALAEVSRQVHMFLYVISYYVRALFISRLYCIHTIYQLFYFLHIRILKLYKFCVLLQIVISLIFSCDFIRLINSKIFIVCVCVCVMIVNLEIFLLYQAFSEPTKRKLEFCVGI